MFAAPAESLSRKSEIRAQEALCRFAKLNLSDCQMTGVFMRKNARASACRIYAPKRIQKRAPPHVRKYAPVRTNESIV
jgi:hypothetical protein